MLTRKVCTVHITVAIIVDAIAAGFVSNFCIAAIAARWLITSIDAALATHVFTVNVSVAVVVYAVAAICSRLFSEVSTCVGASIKAGEVFTVGVAVAIVVDAICTYASVIAFVPLCRADGYGRRACAAEVFAISKAIAVVVDAIRA
mgnify:CR=1 FL=1